MSLLVTVVGPCYTPRLIHFIQHSQQRLSLQTGWAEMSLFAIINNLIFDVQYSSPHIFFSPLLCLFFFFSVCVCVCAWSGAGAVGGATWGNESIWVHALERWRWRKHAGCSVNTKIVTQILAQDACHHIWFWFFVCVGGEPSFFCRFTKRGRWKTYSKDEFTVITCKTTYLLGCLTLHFLF